MSIKYLLFAAFLTAISCGQSSGDGADSKAQLTSQKTLEFPKLLDRSEALRYGKEWDEVQNFYSAQCSALRLNPQDFEARLKLAECFIQEARVTGEHPHYYPAAMEMVEGVIRGLETKTTPNIKEKDLLFRALSHKASIQLSLHDFAAAKTTAEMAIALNPYNAYILGCLVDAHVELGQYAKAVEVCDKMVSVRPDLRSYARVSYLREIHGDPKGAIQAMEMAVSAGYPGYEQTEWARLQLGQMHEKYGDDKQAEMQYKMALEFRPNYPFALGALAGLESKKGNQTKALELLHQAADIVPEIGFYIDMAKIYREQGNKETFSKLIPEIEAMFQEDMAAGHNMSMEAARFQLEIKGDTGKALELLQNEQKNRSENIDLSRLLAEIYLKAGDKTASREALARANATNSKDPELLKLQTNI